MNRLDKLFSEKNTGLLNVYCTAGYPLLESTPQVLKALQQYGADIIELGIPYSDPIADGPVIQQSNMQALQNGMNIQLLFEQLKDARTTLHTPLILMGYMNPILQFGMEKFCAAAAQVGVDGVILPDLPMHEYETQYQQYFKQHDIKFIFLVTPETSIERIKKIDQLSSGFVYAVSSSSTTGYVNNHTDSTTNTNQEAYFKKLKQLNLNNPIMVGFGIHNKESFQAACKYTNGAIIGSAYIHAIQFSKDLAATSKDFINSIKDQSDMPKTQ